MPLIYSLEDKVSGNDFRQSGVFLKHNSRSIRLDADGDVFVWQVARNDPNQRRLIVLPRLVETEQFWLCHDRATAVTGKDEAIKQK